MEFLRRFRILIIGVLTLMLVGAGVFLDKSLNSQTEALTQEIKGKREKLDKYYADKENAPSPYLIAKLTREKLFLEGNYESLRSRYTLIPVMSLPQDEIFPSLFSKERIYLEIDSLRGRAAKEGINIPANLGLSETGLPPADQIPTLLILLDTIKRVCEEVFKSKLYSLNSLQLSEPVTNPFYVEIPIAISVTANSSRVAYFLENLGVSQNIFVLENMSMNRNGDNVDAQLSLKRILWGKELVDQIKPVGLASQPAGPAPGAPAPEMPPTPPEAPPTGP